MDKVVHFEIPADDLERAKKFYQSCFKWEIQPIPEMDYTILHTVPVDKKTRVPKVAGAINGGMFKRQASMPNVQIYINVSDIEKSLEKVKSEGGEILREKTPVGEMGFTANFKDTEGNIVGLWEDAGKIAS